MINFQNVQTAHAAPYPKNKQPHQKMPGISKWTSLKVDIETAKKRMKKMFNIMSYQKNANQNYNEVSPHICQNGHHQKIYTELSATECVEERLPALSGECKLLQPPWRMAGRLQKTIKRSTIPSSNLTTGHVKKP